MNLKKYQEDILNEDLDAYLSALDESNDIIKACLIVVATQDYSWLVRTTDNTNTGKISLYFR